MSRRRSGAFHAESNEEYIKIAIDNQDQDNCYYNQVSTKSRGDYHQLKSTRVQNTYDDFAFDLEEDGQESSSDSELKNSPSTYSLNDLDDSAVTQCLQPEFIVQDIKIDCMLIGERGVGKHALINSQFPEISDSDSSPLNRNRMDLVLRKTNTSTTQTSYQFWIKELVDESYETLINLYYKRCSFFVFVYDLTSKDSFEKMEREIIKVRNCVGESRFNGLLIATSADKADERAITYEAGVELKLRYNLQYFCETSVAVECETQQFLKKLQSLASTLKEREIY